MLPVWGLNLISGWYGEWRSGYKAKGMEEVRRRTWVESHRKAAMSPIRGEERKVE